MALKVGPDVERVRKLMYRFGQWHCAHTHTCHHQGK